MKMMVKNALYLLAFVCMAPVFAADVEPVPVPVPDAPTPAPVENLGVKPEKIAKSIKDFKNETVRILKTELATLKKAEDAARQGLLKEKRPSAQKAATDDGKPGPYLGALLHWAKANAALQEAETTLEYVESLPEHMVLPVTTLTHGVEQARVAVETIHGLNKTRRDANLRAFQKQETRKKGQIKFKQADYTAALRAARDDLAMYYEVLSKWYAGVPAFFEQRWHESMLQLDQQILIARRMQADLQARGNTLKIAVGAKKEIEIALDMPAAGEVADDAVLPPALTQLSNEDFMATLEDKGRKEKEEALEKRWHTINDYVVSLVKRRATIKQSDGHIGKREFVEQRKALWDQAKGMVDKARKVKGSLDNQSHPFHAAQRYETSCREWYERDAGRFQAEDMVHKTHQQIQSIARDIRMVDEETPGENEHSAKGFAVFKQEMVHALSPHFLEGTKIMSYVTAGVGKHVANFKQMQPVWQEFENRLSFLRNTFPELNVLVSGARWFVSLNAPGLAMMA